MSISPRYHSVKPQGATYTQLGLTNRYSLSNSFSEKTESNRSTKTSSEDIHSNVTLVDDCVDTKATIIQSSRFKLSKISCCLVALSCVSVLLVVGGVIIENSFSELNINFRIAGFRFALSKVLMFYVGPFLGLAVIFAKVTDKIRSSSHSVKLIDYDTDAQKPRNAGEVRLGKQLKELPENLCSEFQNKLQESDNDTYIKDLNSFDYYVGDSINKVSSQEAETKIMELIKLHFGHPDTDSQGLLYRNTLNVACQSCLICLMTQLNNWAKALNETIVLALPIERNMGTIDDNDYKQSIHLFVGENNNMCVRIQVRGSASNYYLCSGNGCDLYLTDESSKLVMEVSIGNTANIEQVTFENGVFLASQVTII